MIETIPRAELKHGRAYWLDAGYRVGIWDQACHEFKCASHQLPSCFYVMQQAQAREDVGTGDDSDSSSLWRWLRDMEVYIEKREAAQVARKPLPEASTPTGKTIKVAGVCKLRGVRVVDKTPGLLARIDALESRVAELSIPPPKDKAAARSIEVYVLPDVRDACTGSPMYRATTAADNGLHLAGVRGRTREEAIGGLIRMYPNLFNVWIQMHT
jgi:hypothetical protein